ncbi:HNH endonuclease signature motif containing protein [Protaetiibacter larvae]|uniref:HNH endonuclease n=1 Tax=Protaetiibacter larvae TaxID=2592654 RepID=A0A5C1Y653_9MICO|nr:HNH endonuclease signature motif containing protein [Protaetiibacter larvae]QEO09523.1 HNH endonuclease [Protaetiibacter larvae]
MPNIAPVFEDPELLDDASWAPFPDPDDSVPALPPSVLEQWGLWGLLSTAEVDADTLRHADDAELLQFAEVFAAQERQVRAQSALVAGEIARRSRPELGFGGLARKLGHRTAEELVRVTTGSTLSDAKRTVQVGTLLVEAADADAVPAADPVTGEVTQTRPTVPWMVPVAHAVRSGTISVEKADAIRRGLGKPDPFTGDPEQDAGRITTETLTAAAATLAGEAPSLDADRLLKRAMELRDELDLAGVAVRERRRRDARSFRVFTQPDGMTRAVWLMDPETAAIVSEIHQRVTSPKLGGPRFVHPDELARAEQVLADPRTAEQYASDTMLDLLRAGYTADPTLVPGDEVPAVRVLVTHTDLHAGVGIGFIEGQSVPVSLRTVERQLCEAGTEDLILDAQHRPLDLGRRRRLFSRRQRRALAARDGGCMFPGCERPPVMTEAHHIKHWLRDRGKTDIDNGILLCRHHHMLMHDAGWEIEHRGGTDYRLIPPAGVDPARRPIPLRSKSPVYRRALSVAGAP